MGSLNNYLYEADDPYKILAQHIVGFYRPADVLKILTDNSYLKNCVVKECRDLDLGGPFIDCIIENILAEKDRMEWMHELDAVGTYLFSRLDRGRLRDEIVQILNDTNISLGV